MTDVQERLAAIQKRLEASTPGPWCAENCGDKCNDIVIGTAYHESDELADHPLSGWADFCDEDGNEIAFRDEMVCALDDSCSNINANADFILHAQDDIKWLLAHGVTFRADAVREWIEGLRKADPYRWARAWGDAAWEKGHAHEFPPNKDMSVAALLALCGGSEHEGSGSGAMTRPDAREVGPPDAPPATYSRAGFMEAERRKQAGEDEPLDRGEPNESRRVRVEEVRDLYGNVKRRWIDEVEVEVAAPTPAQIEAALREIDDLAQCIRLTENDKDTSRALLTAQCHALAIQDHLDDLGITGTLRLAAARTEE